MAEPANVSLIYLQNRCRTFAFPLEPKVIENLAQVTGDQFHQYYHVICHGTADGTLAFQDGNTTLKDLLDLILLSRGTNDPVEVLLESCFAAHIVRKLLQDQGIFNEQNFLSFLKTAALPVSPDAVAKALAAELNKGEPDLLRCEYLGILYCTATVVDVQKPEDFDVENWDTKTLLMAVQGYFNPNTCLPLNFDGKNVWIRFRSLRERYSQSSGDVLGASGKPPAFVAAMQQSELSAEPKPTSQKDTVISLRLYSNTSPGGCTILRIGDDNLLIDAFSSNDKGMSDWKDLPGEKKAVIVTHCDKDHIGPLSSSDHWKTGNLHGNARFFLQFYLTKTLGPVQQKDLCNELAKRKVPYAVPSQKDEFKISDTVMLKFLSPDKKRRALLHLWAMDLLTISAESAEAAPFTKFFFDTVEFDVAAVKALMGNPREIKSALKEDLHGTTLSPPNIASLAFVVEVQRTNEKVYLLFTGDAPAALVAKGLVEVYGANIPRFAYVEAPHHGSKMNQPELLFNVISFERLGISCPSKRYDTMYIEGCAIDVLAKRSDPQKIQVYTTAETWLYDSEIASKFDVTYRVVGQDYTEVTFDAVEPNDLS